MACAATTEEVLADISRKRKNVFFCNPGKFLYTTLQDPASDLKPPDIKNQNLPAATYRH